MSVSKKLTSCEFFVKITVYFLLIFIADFRRIKGATYHDAILPEI